MEEGGEAGAALLQQLNCILSSDTLIDELGFVHPTQLASLHEAEGTPSTMEHGVHTSAFWCADHKLAVSTKALAPLFRAAKSAFIAARAEYQSLLSKSHDNSVTECGNAYDDDVRFLAEKLLSCSRAVVVLNSGYKTAWDVRKQIFKNLSMVVPLEELQLSSLVLSFNPKCEEAWAQRRWTIRSRVESNFLPEHLLQEESKLIAVIADRSRMNYRAWHHCCWLVSWMSISQVLHQLHRWKEWAQLHVADNCCFHFRRCLFQRLLIEGKVLEVKDAWLDEIEWNKGLINLYIGREALWIHRRFLFFIWLHYLKEVVGCCYPRHVVPTEKNEWDQHFLESEIVFANACVASCTEDNCEDGQKHLIFACTFKLWVLLQCKASLALFSKNVDEVKQLLQMKAPLWRRLWEGLFKSQFAQADEDVCS